MKPQPVSLLPALSALTALTFFSGFCQAATETTGAGIPDPLAGLGQMLFGLAIVLGILAACVWLLKRFSSPVRANGLLRVLGVTAVGPREKVMLVEVGEKVLMLGVTPNNVQTLHVFERGELPLESMSVTPSGKPGNIFSAAFADRLTQALKGHRNAS